MSNYNLQSARDLLKPKDAHRLKVEGAEKQIFHAKGTKKVCVGGLNSHQTKQTPKQKL